VIRQSGIYHRFNKESCQSTFVLFNPVPNSKAHQLALKWLHDNQETAETEPFWLHRILFSTYFPAWRSYLTALERDFLPIANTTFSSFIEDDLRVGYDSLSKLVSLENRFLQIPVIIASAIDVLEALGALLVEMSVVAATHPGTQELKNHHRSCLAYSRSASHLQLRAQTTAQLLSNTLSFRDQVVAKEQNGNMLRLNKSAVFITALTLLYLPASFVAVSFLLSRYSGDG
jgi:hypothetical protein